MINLELADRDELMKYFLPGQAQRYKYYISYDTQNEIDKIMLCTDNLGKRLGIKMEESPEEAPDQYLFYKNDFYHQKYEIYSRIFDLCRVLGITNVYDIGCETINQAFLLAAHTNISYTGMDSVFNLNDWREEDEQSNNYWYCYTEEAPSPFCDGRIRFVKGYYPDTVFDVKPNHIAVASCSLTMCMGAESIIRVASALVRDFDRILINFPYSERRMEDYNCWKNADWSGYEIRPIDYSGFIYATKNEEDIERLKVMYPFDEDEVLDTGIRGIKKGDTGRFNKDYFEDWVRRRGK